MTDFTLWVEYIIKDLTVVANTTFVRPGEMVQYNVTVLQLSRANTTLDYRDGYEDMIYRYEMLTGG